MIGQRVVPQPTPDAAPQATPDARTALQALPIGIALYDQHHRLHFTNPAYCNALAIPPAALHTTRPLEAPDQIRRRHPNGRTFDTATIPLPGGAHMVCVTETTAHTTRRDEAESAIARLYTAVATLPIGLAVFAPNRTIALHNPRFAELLGLPAHAIASAMPFADLLQAMQAREDFASMEGNLFLAAQFAQDRTRPTSCRRHRTNNQVIEVLSNPLPDGGWTLIVTDITPPADAEHQANIQTHPLSGTIDTTPTPPAPNPTTPHLANDTIDLPRLLRACLRPFDAAAAAAEIALVVDLPEHLPRIRANERHLHQAIGRLLSTALHRASPAGSICIAARHDWTTGDLLIQVQDTGPSIPSSGIPSSGTPCPNTPSSSTSSHNTTATLTIPANQVLPDDPAFSPARGLPATAYEPT